LRTTEEYDMGKNRQPPTDTSSTDTSETDTTQATDFTQQQQQPPPTGRAEAPIGDDSVNNPVIINR
jgi:hypothetical protein